MLATLIAGILFYAFIIYAPDVLKMTLLAIVWIALIVGGLFEMARGLISLF